MNSSYSSPNLSGPTPPCTPVIPYLEGERELSPIENIGSFFQRNSFQTPPRSLFKQHQQEPPGKPRKPHMRRRQTLPGVSPDCACKLVLKMSCEKEEKEPITQV
jgi:hypothetical protein